MNRLVMLDPMCQRHCRFGLRAGRGRALRAGQTKCGAGLYAALHDRPRGCPSCVRRPRSCSIPPDLSRRAARIPHGRLSGRPVAHEVATGGQRQIRAAQSMPPTTSPTTRVLSRIRRMAPLARNASTIGPHTSAVRVALDRSGLNSPAGRAFGKPTWQLQRGPFG